MKTSLTLAFKSLLYPRYRKTAILSFFLLLFFSCDTERDTVVDSLSKSISANNMSVNIKEARASYEDLINRKSNFREAKKNEKKAKTSKKKLFWNEAHIQTINNQQRLVVPFQLDQEIYAQYADGARIPFSQTSYFTAYMKNGQYEYEIITEIPDLDFLLYAKKMADFSGTVLIEDTFGNFIKGYKIKNKLAYDLTVRESSPNGRLRDQVYCTTVDWYSCASGDGGSTWTCTRMYTEVVCETSGGGGGTNTYGVIGDWTPTGGGGGDTGQYTMEPYPDANSGYPPNRRLCVPSVSNIKRVGDDWFLNLDAVGLSVAHVAHPDRKVNGEVLHACFAIPAYDMPASAAAIAITNAINYARSRVYAEVASGVIGVNPNVMRTHLIEYIEESLGVSNPGYSFTKQTCPGANMPAPVKGRYEC